MSVHRLQLSYQQFLKKKKSLADTIIDKYIVYQNIGTGAFGSVYRGMDDITKKQVAIKVLDLVSIQRDQSSPKVKQIRRRLAKSQSQLMMKVNNDHAMKLYDVYQSAQLKIMVIQYCNGGNLSDQIMKKKKIPQQQAIDIIKQIIIGLSALHQENIIHRDLKSDNIMSHNGVYKIVDFGFAKLVPSNTDIYGTVLGTIITMAPQVMKRQKYGLKADIWSIGIILYEMIYGKLPYDPMKSTEMYDQIMKKNIFPNEGKVNGVKPSPQVLTLLKKLIVIDHNHRLDWKQLVQYPILYQKQLPGQYRVTVDLNTVKNTYVPIPQRKQDDVIKKIQQTKTKIQQITQKTQDEPKPIKIEPLSQQQKQIKKKQVDRVEVQLVKWAIINHLQCLKTQLIYRQILIPIQQKRYLDLKTRKVVQFMYLIISRCYCNMSFVLKDFVDSKNPIVSSLKCTVQSLYKQVSQVFQKYSRSLTAQQSKVYSIIGDRFGRIFHPGQLNTKDKFLTGIQNFQFTKQQQIQYTYQNYIKPLISQFERYDNTDVYDRLKNYKKINSIQVQDLKNKIFSQRVQEIIQQSK